MLENHLSALYKELGIASTPEKAKDKTYPIEIQAKAKISATELFPGMYLRSVLGPLPEEEREEKLAHYSFANLLGQGTGRARLGLDAAGKAVTLTMHTPEDMSYTHFKECIEEFANFVDYWKEEL